MKNPLLLLLLAIFSGNAHAQSASPNALADHPWFLTKARMAKKLVDAPKGQREARIEFKPGEDRVFGSDGCNNFFGKVQIRGSAMLFSDLAGTRMACADDNLSPAFNRLMGEVNRYRLQDQQLHLCRNGKVLMTFKSELVAPKP